jgi:TetR/AcrR family transcriptional regulator, acrAB operon repressor
VGGDIRRGIDAEKEVAGLHLGAFGVIDGLQDARDARADFHLADAFHLRRGDGLLGEVGRSDGDDGHGQRAGDRRGALLAATDEGQQGGSEQKPLDSKGFTYRHVCKSKHPDMARKTKAEAAQTRDRIVVSAREVFSRHGVTNTSLEEVAKEAGVTRGAVYWHFRDKADLFMAVRQQTGVLLRFPDESVGDPLRRLELGLQSALNRLAEEKAAQETYEVMLWKCEYIGAFAGVRQDLMTAGDQFLADTTALYAAAKSAKLTPPGLDPRLSAQETFCFYAGLLKLWLADESGRALRGDVRQLIASHVASRRRSAAQKAV